MMGIFGHRRASKTRRQKLAEHLAMVAFLRGLDDDAYASASVLGEDVDRCVVQVSYSTTRPPRRKFYSVENDASEARLIDFDEAKEFGARVWR
jgi:hypothetical protein